MNQSFYRFLDKLFYSNTTAIIMYHGLTDTAGDLFNYHGKHLHIENFKAQLNYLKAHYNVISLNTFLMHRHTQTQPPAGSVILTFDDGYESNYALGFPLLKEFNMPATIYLTTDFIEQKQFIWANRIEYSILATMEQSLHLTIKETNLSFPLSSNDDKMHAIDQVKTLLKPLGAKTRLDTIQIMEEQLGAWLDFNGEIPAIHRPLTWAQIREMAASELITLGGHTTSHEICTALNETALEEDLVKSKSSIEQNLNQPISHFCYPYGNAGTFNENTQWMLEKCGYSSALTTIQGINDTSSNVFELKRLGTSNAVDLSNFQHNLLPSRKLLRRLGIKF